MTIPIDFDFTQSNLQDYVDCAYRFYLRYIMHIKWPALLVDDAIEFEARAQTGARFHRLIQQYLSGVPEERITDMAIADPTPEVSAWWHGFLTHVPPLLTGKRFVETTLSTILNGYRLIAKYDLVLVGEEEELIIFDWKTTQHQPKKETLLKRIQTRLYPLVLTLSGHDLNDGQPVPPEKIRMNYWFSSQPEALVSTYYDPDSFLRDQAYFSNLIDEIHKKEPADFLRTDDLKKCRYCVYRSHCDRGIQAGDLAHFDEDDFFLDGDPLDIEFEEIPEIQF